MILENPLRKKKTFPQRSANRHVWACVTVSQCYIYYSTYFTVTTLIIRIQYEMCEAWKNKKRHGEIKSEIEPVKAKVKRGNCPREERARERERERVLLPIILLLRGGRQIERGRNSSDDSVKQAAMERMGKESTERERERGRGGSRRSRGEGKKEKRKKCPANRAGLWALWGQSAAVQSPVASLPVGPARRRLSPLRPHVHATATATVANAKDTMLLLIMHLLMLMVMVMDPCLTLHDYYQRCYSDSGGSITPVLHADAPLLLLVPHPSFPSTSLWFL